MFKNKLNFIPVLFSLIFISCSDSNKENNVDYFPLNKDKEYYLKLGTAKVKARLEQENIHPRRYFYPSLEDLPYINSDDCPMAQDLAKRVLCLPLYVDLSKEDLLKIVNLLNNA